MLLLAYAACDTDNMLRLGCERTEVALDAATPPVTEEEVWDTVAAFVPTVASWTEFSSDGTTEAPVTWSLTRDSGPAVAVTYGGEDEHCSDYTALGIPVVITIDIADGAARQTRSTLIEATGTGRDAISIYDAGVLTDDVHAELSAKWTAACATTDERDWGTLDEAWLVYSGTLESPRVEVDGGRTTLDAKSWGLCFYGDLGDGEADTAVGD